MQRSLVVITAGAIFIACLTAVVIVPSFPTQSLAPQASDGQVNGVQPQSQAQSMPCNVQEWQWAFKNHIYASNWFDGQKADLTGYIDYPPDFPEQNFSLARDVKDNPMSKPDAEAHIVSVVVVWDNAQELVEHDLHSWVRVEGTMQVSRVNGDIALVLYGSQLTQLTQPPTDPYLYLDSHGSQASGETGASGSSGAGAIADLHKNGMLYNFSPANDPALPAISTGQVLRSAPCTPLYSGVAGVGN